MPTNMYGPGDNFHPDNSHVAPGMMRRFHEAKLTNAPHVVIWGTGTPRREFLFIDDCAEALFVLMQNYDAPEIINVGTGEDITILELAQTMKKIVGFQGEILLDPTKPDGTPRKVLDVSKISRLGWKASVSLEEGLARTYIWALEHKVFD